MRSRCWSAATKTLRRRVTVVGSLAGLEIGAGLRLRGRFEKHPRYGEQFRVEDFETVRPAGVAALERYLASEIKGVGPALARRIAEHFGEALPAVLDTTPERLHEVRGLARLVAQRIVAAWRDSSGLRELTVFLRGTWDCRAAHARRIHKIYGRESLETVRSDPYVLARTIAGIGFRTADTVAEKLGIPRNSIQRARAAVVYLLERMAEEGHVFVPFEYLENQFGTRARDGPGTGGRGAVEELVAERRAGGRGVGGDDHRASTCAACTTPKPRSPSGFAADAGGARWARRWSSARWTRRRAPAVSTLSAEQRAALRCALQSQGHRDHRRSRHRQDHTAALAAGALDSGAG